MESYVIQLLEDLAFATENVSWPFVEKEVDLWDWIPEEEEDRTAPVRDLEDWTGIRQEMLPPATMLNDNQVERLLEALKKLLDEYNWLFVLQTTVPERIQYETIRQNFCQQAKVKRWHMGFFELCREGTPYGKCTLGEYCQCAFYEELFRDMEDDDRTPEEQRAAELEIEIQHLKRKYGSDWMKYYPYHLDPDYDDEDGNPYDYGFGAPDDEDDDW